MSNFTHKEASVGQKRLRLGVGGPSRSGKTFSALRIAAGIASVVGKPIFLIDTDNEFALDYAGDFKFQHVDFQPPFTPERYMAAVQYCVDQDAGVIVVDHMTHEQTGPGGVLERQQAVEGELAEKWRTTREKAKAASWNLAKTLPHGQFVSYITRVKQPIIFNFRCKDKVKIVKGEGGKQEWVHCGYTPICTEQFDYEMTAMLILPPNSDGKPDPELSEIRKPLRPIVKLGQTIDESLGKRLAQWAAGESIDSPAAQSSGRPTGSPASQQAGESPCITPDEALALEARCAENGISLDRLKKAAGVERLSQIKAADHERAKSWVDQAIARKQPAATA